MVRQYITHLPNTCNVVAWLTVPPTLLATHSYVPSCSCVVYEMMSDPLVSTMMPSHCICSSSRISPSLYQVMTAGGLLRMIWQGSSTDIPRLTVVCGLLPFILSRTGFTRQTHTHMYQWNRRISVPGYITKILTCTQTIITTEKCKILRNSNGHFVCLVQLED